MQDKADAQLLREYAENGREAAFHEIVTRYADLIYSAALRQVDSADLARDITQMVFTDLFRKAVSLARTLRPGSSLAGWLYRATRFEAQDLRRAEVRRVSRERQAMEEFDPAPETHSDWGLLRPFLDKAMAELGEADREAVLLRFFQNQPLRAVGRALGISDDAAQKRISRALQKLRAILSRHARPISAGTLTLALSAHAVEVGPPGLAAAVCSALPTAAATGAMAITSTKALAMTTMHKILIGATLALVVGAGIYQARQNSSLRERIRVSEKTERELSADLQRAKSENLRLADSLKRTETATSAPTTPSSEVLKLRGVANLNAREIAELRAALADRSERLPESFSTLVRTYLGSLRASEKEFQETDALSTHGKLAATLSLTPDQQQQVRAVLDSNVAARTDLEIAAQTGSLPFEEVKKRRGKLARDEEQAIAALLSPAQLAAWQQMQQAGDAPGLKSWANREASRMASTLDLSAEQTAQAARILNDLPPGQGGARLILYSDAGDQLASRMKALDPLLSPQQAERYRRMVQQDIEEHNLMARITRAVERD